MNSHDTLWSSRAQTAADVRITSSTLCKGVIGWVLCSRCVPFHSSPSGFQAEYTSLIVIPASTMPICVALMDISLSITSAIFAAQPTEPALTKLDMASSVKPVPGHPPLKEYPQASLPAPSVRLSVFFA